MDWFDLDFFSSERFSTILEALQYEGQNYRIHPEPEEMFAALELCPLEKTKVLILGQDPYPTPGNAHGLAFSVTKGTDIPASLRNIFEEIRTDIGIDNFPHGCLEHWAKQGVLLLNTSLSVRSGQPGSHSSMGWHFLTSEVIEVLSQHRPHVGFVFWGNHAQGKSAFIKNRKNHLILKSPHPSPLSAHRGFFGSKPFSKINEFLISHDMEPIDWSVEENC